MPAVAGQFYYGTPSKLTEQVESFMIKNAKKERVFGVVSPHAGLIYSGSVAGAVYSSIEFPQTFILLGPNHTGLGAPISLMDAGDWEMPTGTLSVDDKLSHKIAVNVPLVRRDSSAHFFEHSLELQLPFIVFFSPTVKIVPLVMLSASVDECRTLGEGIAEAIKAIGYPVVIAASTDMSHYVPDNVARRKDGIAI
ncbi:MAG: AmmeMemoRadiSam system protein B, partial [Nitrospirota bacterium]